jgi:ligand-binding sensor domain-containing protein/signal transduction histidine kinase/ActR/RegA family two-component response regulator
MTLLALVSAPGFCAIAAAQAVGRPIPAGTPLTQVQHDAWQIREGLPQNGVAAIARDRRGFLWLGTREGLARFDGRRFATFDRRTWPELRHIEITALLASRDDSLWIGTAGGGLARYAHGTLRVFTRADGVPGEVIHTLYEDTHNRVWVATNEGLVYHLDGRFHPPDAIAPLGRTVVLAILQDYDGAFWFGTLREGLVRMHVGTLSRLGTGAGLPDAPVTALAEDERGFVWAGTPRGLYRLRAQRATRVLAATQVHALCVDRGDTLWVGTDRGLVRIASGRPIDRLDDETLSDGTVAALLADPDGSVWIGTRAGGLDRLSARPLLLYGRREGLAGGAATVVYEDQRQRQWIGTRNGLFRQDGDRFVRFSAEAHGLPSNVITALAGNGAGIWVGTDAGVARLDAGAARVVVAAADLPSPRVRMLEFDRLGRLWIATDGGLARYTPDRPLRVYRVADGLSSDAVRIVHVAGDDRVWVGTNGGGVTILDGDRVTHLRTAHGLSSDYITSFHDDEDGGMWIGTYGGGITRLVGPHRCRITAAQGLPDDVVIDLLEDAQPRPHLWVGTSRGLASVPMDVLRAVCEGRVPRMEARLFTVTDRGHWAESSSGHQPASWTARDGRIWFATERGAVVLDPQAVAPLPIPPRAIVERLTLEGEEAPANGLALAAWNGGALRVDWVVPWFAAEPLSFRYRLTGFDDEWTEAGDRPTAAYTNLPPGSYGFEVEADNGMGGRSTSAVIALRLQPRFYQTRSFVVIVAATVLVVAGSGIRLRFHRARERERRLTVLVDERTRALQHEMAERQRDEDARRALDRRMQEGQRLESLGVLAGGIAHDFNNLLVGVLGQAGLAKLDLPPDSPVRDQVEQIECAAVRAAELTSQLLAYAGRGRFVVGQVHLPELVAEMAQLLETAIHKHVDTVFDVAEHVPCIEADAAQIRQVVMNLLTNASDALADRPGLVRIVIDAPAIEAPSGAPADDGARDPRTGLAPGRYVRLVVADTGCGMDAVTRDRIFDPFFTTKFTGRGLGLAAVQGIVRSHHGAILVTSEPGQGTTFEVLFPALTPALRSTAPIAAVEADAVTPGLTVLIVDDDDGVRSVARKALERAGYRVRLAADGEEALGLFARDPRCVDCVLLDLTMPRLSGAETLRALRQVRPDLPVIVSSGFTEADSVPRLGDASADAFIQKPWRTDDLIRLIGSLMAQHRERWETEAVPS